MIAVGVLAGQGQVHRIRWSCRPTRLGRHRDHQVDGRLAGVRLVGLVERRGESDTTSTTGDLGDGVDGHVLDEAAERRTDAARDHPEPADADVQDHAPRTRTAAMSARRMIHGHAAAALDRRGGRRAGSDRAHAA